TANRRLAPGIDRIFVHIWNWYQAGKERALLEEAQLQNGSGRAVARLIEHEVSERVSHQRLAAANGFQLIAARVGVRAHNQRHGGVRQEADHVLLTWPRLRHKLFTPMKERDQRWCGRRSK